MISYIILKMSNEHKQMLQKRCDTGVERHNAMVFDSLWKLQVCGIVEFSLLSLPWENITAKQRISSTLLVLFSWATAIRKNLRRSLYGHVDVGLCKRGLWSQCQSGDVMHGNVCPLQSWLYSKRILKHLKWYLNVLNWMSPRKKCMLSRWCNSPILNSSGNSTPRGNPWKCFVSLAVLKWHSARMDKGISRPRWQESRNTGLWDSQK